jgi:isopropylmalate/homocitrate/citramalate synthase
MKKMQSYRIDAETIKQIDKIGQSEKRTKSNAIEIAVEKYYQELKGKNEMKYNLEQAMELTGAVNEEQFKEAFSGKSPKEINEILVYMFGQEGDDMEFAEEISILVKEI